MFQFVYVQYVKKSFIDDLKITLLSRQSFISVLFINTLWIGLPVVKSYFRHFLCLNDPYSNPDRTSLGLLLCKSRYQLGRERSSVIRSESSWSKSTFIQISLSDLSALIGNINRWTILLTIKVPSVDEKFP